jgi:hypothetical protein
VTLSRNLKTQVIETQKVILAVSCCVMLGTFLGCNWNVLKFKWSKGRSHFTLDGHGRPRTACYFPFLEVGERLFAAA